MRKRRWQNRLYRKRQMKTVAVGLICTLVMALAAPGELATVYAEEPKMAADGGANDSSENSKQKEDSTGKDNIDKDSVSGNNAGKVSIDNTEVKAAAAEQEPETTQSGLAQTTGTVKFWDGGNEQGLQKDMTTRLNNRKLDKVMTWEKSAMGGKRISFEFDQEITFDTVILTSKTKNGLPKNVIFRYPRNNTVKPENLKDGDLIKLDGTDWDVAEDYKGTDDENKDSYSHEYTMTRLNGKPLTTNYLILQFEAPVSNGGAFELYGITFKNSQNGDDGGASEPLDPGSDVEEPDPEEPTPELPQGEPLDVKNLKAEKVDGGIKLSWDAVENARCYKIWRSSDSEMTDIKPVKIEENSEKPYELWVEYGKESYEYIDKEGSPTDFYWISALLFGDDWSWIGETGLSKKCASAEGKVEEEPSDLPTGEPLEVGMSVKKAGDGVAVSWDAVEGAYGYKVWRADSAYPQDEYIECVETYYPEEEADGFTYKDENGKFNSYYWISALKLDEEYQEKETGISTDSVSLEKEAFGDHTLIFSPQDKVETIDDLLSNLFKEQGYEDAQFGNGRWQVYFKPGDYTETKCINVGFYTSVNGLGATPYDVKLNNIAVPPCLPDSNATCSFWRSIENFAVMNTGNTGEISSFHPWNSKELCWAVAQAAPMRRIYSQRPVSYDWCCGWASGGYVADCKFDGKGGTPSGQQFYTRNSVMTRSEGTTLNNFNQGVIAENLPTAATGSALLNGNGYSNWGKEGNAGGVITSVETTPKLSEKPFLYLDGDEYKVFIPAMRTNTKGVSWSESSMGEGTSVSLDSFYMAKPGDTAAEINRQLAVGKNIYFTPGIYYAETPILVNNSNTVVLGTGMTSIIPGNSEAAMIVSDSADNVKISGIIFDAGANSKTLLKVGDNKEKDHSAAPTVLQDFFFRVGGTSSAKTKANIALEINSNDVIGDHFWIWRADHGEGVSWENTRSKNGLVVNGDNVTCYALFNEHFQEYDTLWNGNNGATYFYQNEKCYDPVSQETWMSHGGTVNGYAAYKVANDVEQHYAVGFGIYNVFIYTGPNRDGTVPIQLDNAVEVPNKKGVLMENVCMQTFADDNKALQKFNHIINGVGESVSSGKPGGYGWNRTFITSYRNGTADVGLGRGGFNGTKKVTGIKEIPGEDVPTPDDDDDKPNTGDNTGDDKPNTGDNTGDNKPNTGGNNSGSGNTGGNSGGSGSSGSGNNGSGNSGGGSNGGGNNGSGNDNSGNTGTQAPNNTNANTQTGNSGNTTARRNTGNTASRGNGTANASAGTTTLEDATPPLAGAAVADTAKAAVDTEGEAPVESAVETEEKYDAETVQLEDEETPLAGPTKVSMPAWWMILFVLAGAVGGAVVFFGMKVIDGKKNGTN